MKFIIYFILISVCVFFVHKFLSKFKFPKTGCLVPVVGGVKCGKSTFSCALVRSAYKRSLRSVKFTNFFRKVFNSNKPQLDLPVIYSNVPLNCDFVPLTKDLLLRKTRPIVGSVVYLQEASLVADSQLIKDKDINNELLLFFKLCGHEGVQVILDTQSTSDVHYSIKRSMSQIFNVQHTVKWLPFFLICEVMEYGYSEDGSILFAQNKDSDDVVKRVIIRKSIWKMFDSRAYSSLTDNKPLEPTNIVKGVELYSLKVDKVVSFRPEFNVVVENSVKKECDKVEKT